ncbi:DNA-binding protein [bacterium]|nr:MAG: DNA-binding protein [bacterium]
MKSSLFFSISAFLLLTVLSSSVYSQGWWKFRGSGGWGHKGNYHRLYDTKTVETLSGTIMEIDTITPLKGMSNGIHLMIKTDKEQISVHLGPAWYIDNQDIDLSKNDKVEVKGSRVTIDGKPVIITAELKRGDDTLKLRDDNGFPAWSGWRRR